MDSTGIAADPRPALTTFKDLAGLIDHSVLRPDFSEEQALDSCRLAVSYGVASIIVRPSDAEIVVRETHGTGVLPASVVGFPHGGETTAAKLYEARDLLRRGIREIDLMVNLGKLISRQFQYLEMEVMQVAKACHESGALLKLILETGYLTEDLKVIGCKVAKRAEADFLRPATGFGALASQLSDLAVLKRAGKDRIRLASGLGDHHTLESVLEAYLAGCDRFGTSATGIILEAWKAKLATADQNAPAPTLSEGAY